MQLPAVVSLRVILTKNTIAGFDHSNV